MIIDDKTRARRNKRIVKDREKIEHENSSRIMKKRCNKILKEIRDQYVESGQTQGIELLAFEYSFDLEKVLRRLADMKFITFTNRSDAYYVDFVLPEPPKPNTANVPKAEEPKTPKPKPQKPNIDDFDPPKPNIWEDLT